MRQSTDMRNLRNRNQITQHTHTLEGGFEHAVGWAERCLARGRGKNARGNRAEAEAEARGERCLISECVASRCVCGWLSPPICIGQVVAEYSSAPYGAVSANSW